MRKHTSCLLLCFGETLANNIRTPVKIRQLASPYYNSSRAIVTSNVTTTSATNTYIRSDIQIDTTSVSIDSSWRPDYTGLTGKSKDGGNTLHRTVDPDHNPTGRPSDCIDTIVTYTERPPQTVYVTVNGSYEVPVSASNVSINAPTIYETPLQPCQTTIVPKNPTWGQWASASSTQYAMSSMFPSSTGRPYIEAPVTTLLVTKKTPVVVVQTPTAPPVTFEASPQTTTPRSPMGLVTTLPQTNGKEGGSLTNNNGQNDDNNQNNNNNNSENNSNSNNNNSPNLNSIPNGANTQVSSNVDFQTAAEQSGGNGLASIINSVINSPFAAPPGPAQNQATPTRFIAAAATPTIDGVLVTIGPTNIVIGSQSIALPTSSQAIVVDGTRTFTVRPNEIIAPGTTYRIESQLVAAPTITQAPSIVTAAGITMTISASVAIISGTTYRIGSGAQPTTTVINGQTIIIGSEGVVVSGLPPTTFVPPMTISGGREIVIVDGLTISVGQTMAIISGTTYAIGPGATLTTVTIGGQTLTIGPSGVVLPGTTIKPTSVPTVTASLTSGPVSTAQATVHDSQASSTNTTRFLLSFALTWIVVLLPRIDLSI